MDLDTNCISRCPPKLLDFEILFDPFEEQLYAPPIAIKQGDCLRGSLKIVSQKDVSCAVFRVGADNFPNQFRVIADAFTHCKVPDCIGNDSRRESAFP